MSISNIVSYVIIGVLVVALVAFMIIANKSGKAKKLQEDKTALLARLQETKQHEKYKKIMTIQTCMKIACYIIFILSIIFFIFLPVFKIKYSEKVGDETITLERNFSLYGCFADIWNEPTGDWHKVDADKTMLLVLFVIFTAALMVMTLCLVVKKVRALSDAGRMEYYANLKFKLWETESPLLQFVVMIIPSIYTIIACKNAKYDFSSDLSYTIINTGKYLLYEGENFIFSVYQNDFKLCNGVSGYLAVPIIFFVLGASLVALNLYINYKLRQKILSEDFSGENELIKG